jgi:MFS transporter, DHA1 family, staphyloferrin A biosynthesis exporter
LKNFSGEIGFSPINQRSHAIVTSKLNFKNVQTFESLKLRDFRLLWLSQLNTGLGGWMDQTARSWLVYSLTHSAFQLGLINAVRGIPMIFFGAVAGVLADRYGRKIQLIVAQAIYFVLNILLATLVITGRIEVWHIYVTGFFAGAVWAFQQPAGQALISDLVDEKHVLNAVSLNSAGQNMSRIVGPSLAGLLIQFLGVGFSYYFQAAMYVIAIVWTSQMQVPKTLAPVKFTPAPQRQPFFPSLREGFNYILSHRVILALLVLALTTNFLGAPYLSLMPIFAIDVFHGNAGTQGLLLTMGGVGAIVGALAIASMGRAQTNIKMLFGGAAAYGLCLIIFSRSSVLAMAMGATFLSSCLFNMYLAQAQTLIQTTTPGGIRGRVLSVYYMSNGLMPLGSLMIGAIAAILGAPWAVTIMGMACFLVVVGVLVSARDLRNFKSKSKSEIKSAT